MCPEDNTQSHKLLRTGLLWARREGGKPRAATGVLLFWDTQRMALPVPHRALMYGRHRWTPWDFTVGSVSLSKESLKKC